uniref:EGF-like domain-containing protein n=1 Tax=Phaeomonas parva TaxID=124430 RepID=A0A6U4ELF8_9STRA|mmetsp:Transcript_21106/g.64286  ORF Transcript_21106/g.64286 Transcript_21106/m.64286 type:complete len:391 (+) Transcript_21106:436-1608(+)
MVAYHAFDTSGLSYGENFYALYMAGSTEARVKAHDRQMWMSVSSVMTDQTLDVVYYQPSYGSWVMKKVSSADLPARTSAEANLTEIDAAFVDALHVAMGDWEVFNLMSDQTFRGDPSDEDLRGKWVDVSSVYGLWNDRDDFYFSCVECDVGAKIHACKFGGQCVVEGENGVASTCDCPAGFTGLSDTGRYCRSGDCLDFSHCDCPTGYGGYQCEQPPAEALVSVAVRFNDTCWVQPDRQLELVSGCQALYATPFVTQDADGNDVYSNFLMDLNDTTLRVLETNLITDYDAMYLPPNATHADGEYPICSGTNVTEHFSIHRTGREIDSAFRLLFEGDNSTLFWGTTGSFVASRCNGMSSRVTFADLNNGDFAFWGAETLEWAGLAVELAVE